MEEDDRYTRITLRIPKDLHGQLSGSAAETSKSMNAEIVARLQASFGGAASGEYVRQLENAVQSALSAGAAKEGVIAAMATTAEVVIESLPDSPERRLLKRMVDFVDRTDRTTLDVAALMEAARPLSSSE